jgi:hypothetical protein
VAAKRWTVGRGLRRIRNAVPKWAAEAAVTGAASAAVAAVIATHVVSNMGATIRSDIQKVRDRL